jgi:uncharacterized protein YqeY
MIDVQAFLIKAMKKELFKTDSLNNAARLILGELKTKLKDIREPITTEIQYKILQKMKKDRENAVMIYNEAFEKSKSDVAKYNLDKAKTELEPLDLFLNELESKMPKKLSEEEIKKLVEETLAKFGDKPNKGIVMKLFKDRNDVDMATVAKIVNSLLK